MNEKRPLRAITATIFVFLGPTKPGGDPVKILVFALSRAANDHSIVLV